MAEYRVEIERESDLPFGRYWVRVTKYPGRIYVRGMSTYTLAGARRCAARIVRKDKKRGLIIEEYAL